MPLKAPAGTLRGGISIDHDSLRVATRRLRFDGILLVSNLGSSCILLLPEAFGKVRLGVFELYVDRRRELVGLADSMLSTGSYAWSGNALPVPKIQLEIRSFVLWILPKILLPSEEALRMVGRGRAMCNLPFYTRNKFKSDW